MAADFFLGESLVGDGNEVAHIDLMIGSKSGPAGNAFANALAITRTASRRCSPSWRRIFPPSQTPSCSTR